MEELGYDIFVSYARKDNVPLPGKGTAGFVDLFLENIKKEHRLFTSSDLNIFFDRENIQSMDDWNHRLQEGLRHSKILLAFLSPSYFESPFCRWEWETYLKHEQSQALSGRGIAPVYFVEVPDFDTGNVDPKISEWVSDLKRRQFVDLREWQSAGAALLRESDVRQRMLVLGQSISDRLEQAARASQAIGLIDRHNSHFVGRREEIRRLREMLAMDRVGVITALHGLGGVGKTALAVEYAHAYASEYPGGRWTLQCENETEIKSVFLQLVSPLGIVLSAEEKADVNNAFLRIIAELKKLTFEKAEEFSSVSSGANNKQAERENLNLTGLLQKVFRKAQKKQQGGMRPLPNPKVRPACLLILDNISHADLLAESQLSQLPIEDWLHILTTTRLGSSDFGSSNAQCQFLPLDQLPECDGVALIQSHQPDGRFSAEDDHEAARLIVRALGGFTLAVESAAVFLGVHAGEIPFRAFLDRLKNEEGLTTDVIASDSGDAHVGATMRHREKQLSAVVSSLLERLSDAEKETLYLASLMPPDCVVLPWILGVAKENIAEFAEPVRPGYPDPWRMAVRRLVGWRLLTPARDEAPDENGNPRVYRLHRLVGEYLRGKMADRLNAQKQRIHSLVDRRIQHLRQTYHLQDNQWEIVPFRIMMEMMVRENVSVSCNSALCVAELLNKMANYSESLQLVRLCSNEADGQEAAEELKENVMFHLASDFFRCAQKDAAEDQYRELLNRREARNDVKGVISVLDNLGLMLAADRPLEAEKMLRRSLKLCEEHKIGNAYDLAMAGGRLANALIYQGRNDEAVPLLEKEVEAEIAAHGNVHPSVAMAKNNLAEALRRAGRFDEAEPHFREALEINRQCLPDDHPDIATDINNFAMFLDTQNRHEEAHPYYRESIRRLAEYKEKTGLKLSYYQGIVQNYRISLMDAGVSSGDVETYIQSLKNGIEESSDKQLLTSSESDFSGQRFGWMQLLNASILGNLSLVQEILNSGIPATASREDGSTALHGAAHNGHLEICKLLVSCGADVDARTKDNISPLWLVLSCEKDSKPDIMRFLLEEGASTEVCMTLETVTEGTTILMSVSDRATAEILLEFGADIEARNVLGNTPLYRVAKEGNKEVLELFLEKGAAVDGVNNEGGSALWVAAACGYTEICRLLLDAGADLHLSCNDGYTPLMMVCNRKESDSPETVELLLNSGADIEAASNDRWRALMLAASRGHVQTGTILLKHGADIHAVNSAGGTALWMAAANGNLEFCRLLLDHGAKIDSRNSTQCTPLMRACMNEDNDYHETVALLLERGADVEAASEKGWRSLMSAAQYGHIRTGKVLLKKRADVNARKDDNGTALWVAAYNGRTEFCRMLLEYNAEVNLSSDEGNSPLIMACKNEGQDLYETVALLLEKGAVVSAQNSNGWQPLMQAAQYGHVQSGKVLLENGAEVNARKKDGGTALWIAAFNGRTEFCRMLLEHGAEVDASSDTQVTPLVMACANEAQDQSETVALLLNQGADIEAQTQNGFRPLMQAASSGHIETGRLLLQRGADISARKTGGGTALWVSAFNGHAEFCQLLLDHGAEIDTRDDDGHTPLMKACNSENVDQFETVELLLRQGADSKAVAEEGWRPLMVAALRGHVETGRLLLAHGAEINVQNDSGLTALAIAASHGHSEFIRLLLDHAAEVDQCSNDRFTPLMRACDSAKTGLVDIVSLLLSSGANVNAVSDQGWSSLILAAKHGHTDLAELLIDRGAEIDMKKAGGHTALCVAAFNGHSDFCRFLLDHHAELDVRDNESYTPFLRAGDNAERDQSAMLELLTDRGADIKAVQKGGWTALMLAAQHGHIETAKFLLARGAEIDAKKNDGWSALIIAASHGYTEFCRLLLEYGATVDLRNSNGETALLLACNNESQDYAELVALLLEKGACADSETENGWTPFLLACRYGHVQSAELLLERGVSVNAKTASGRYPLLEASAGGSAALCRLLLEHGAKGDVPDSEGWTPLMYICNHADEDLSDIVSPLLEAGASPDRITSTGWTLLMIAAQYGHLKTAQLLLECGVDVNAGNCDNNTALWVAASRGHTEFCRLLLEHGAAIDSAGNSMYTPLMVACNNAENELAEMVGLLVERGADVEASGADGWRPLMIAAQYGYSDIGRILLDHEAELEAVKDDNATALLVAAANGREDFCRMLIERGAEKRAMCMRGYTAATWASGAANMPELLPILFDVDEFSLERVLAVGGAVLSVQVLVEAHACASDLALRSGDAKSARKILEDALAEIDKEANGGPEQTYQRMIFARLVYTCYETKEYQDAVSYQQNEIALLRSLANEDQAWAQDLSEALGMLCWYLLLTGSYAQTLPAAEEAAQLVLYEGACPVQMNLLHALLFNGHFDKAVEIHEKFRGTAFADGRNWDDELMGDFKILREAGKGHSDIQKIEALISG